MDSIRLMLRGQSPLLMHSDRLVNPLDPIAIKIKELTSKKKKTEEDHRMIARLEWEGGMYFNEEIGPYLPAHALKACFARGGTKSKMGTKTKAGLYVYEDKVKLEYKGPRNLEGLWDDGNFVDMRPIVISGKRLMRCRPIFLDWKVQFDVWVDGAEIGIEDVLPIAKAAGHQCGIGDFRIEKGGGFGRFDVEQLRGEA